MSESTSLLGPVWGVALAALVLAGWWRAIVSLLDLRDHTDSRASWLAVLRGKGYSVLPSPWPRGVWIKVATPFPAWIRIRRRGRSQIGYRGDAARTSGNLDFDSRFAVDGPSRHRTREFFAGAEMRQCIAELFNQPVERLALTPGGLSAWIPANQFRQLGSASLPRIAGLLQQLSGLPRATPGVVAKASQTPPVVAPLKTKAAIPVPAKVAKPEVGVQPARVPSGQVKVQALGFPHLLYPVRFWLLMLGILGFWLLRAAMEAYRPLNPASYLLVEGGDFIYQALGFGGALVLVFSLPALVLRRGRLFRLITTAVLAAFMLPLFAAGLFAAANGLLAGPQEPPRMMRVLGKELRREPGRGSGGFGIELDPNASPSQQALTAWVGHFSRFATKSGKESSPILTLVSLDGTSGARTIQAKPREFMGVKPGDLVRLITRPGWIAGDLVVHLEPAS